jgi:hypothetical protein
LLFSSSSTTIQASSASLLNDSQKGFVFLKHKAYNYDNEEAESDSTTASKQQLLTGLFGKEGESASESSAPADSGSFLFKEEKQIRKKPPANNSSVANNKASARRPS